MGSSFRWLWVKTNGIPFWGRCTTHFRTYFSVIGMFTGGTGFDSRPGILLNMGPKPSCLCSRDFRGRTLACEWLLAVRVQRATKCKTCRCLFLVMMYVIALGVQCTAHGFC